MHQNILIQRYLLNNMKTHVISETIMFVMIIKSPALDNVRFHGQINEYVPLINHVMFE